MLLDFYITQAVCNNADIMTYKRWAKRLTILACFVGVIVAGYWFATYVAAPSQATIMPSTAALNEPSSTGLFDYTPVPVHNAYFSFSYPASMHAYAQQPVKAPELADYSYGYQDIESWQLAVSAQTLAETSLSQDSSYIYRTQHADQYQLSNTTINGYPVAIITDTKAAGFSKVAFMLHGSEVIHISLYGNDTSGISMLNNVFTQILHSVQWVSS